MFGIDPVDQILELLGDLAGEDRRDWAGAARSERVVGLARITERAQAALVGATAEWDGQLDWTADGACSPATWLARHAPVSKGKADRLVRSARLVRRHERTAKALAAGDLTSHHLEVLADKTRRREDLYADHEDTLLDAALALDVDNFAKAAETWRLHADAVRANAEMTDAVEHAHFHLSQTFDGRYVPGGELDPEGGTIVLAALDARCRPDPGGAELAPRTLSERRAAALVEMAAESLARTSPGGRAPNGVDVIIDVATLRGEPAGDLTKIRCELGSGTPITTETALRLGCDATVGRVRHERPLRNPRPRTPHPRRLRRATPRADPPRCRLRLPRV